VTAITVTRCDGLDSTDVRYPPIGRELRRDGKAVLGGRSALPADSTTGDLAQAIEQPGIWHLRARPKPVDVGHRHNRRCGCLTSRTGDSESFLPSCHTNNE
jgi:hypothetical protein